MFEVAYGVLGLSPSEFWQMTPREFFCAWAGRNDRDGDLLEQAYKANRAVVFSAIRQHGAWTAWSQEASEKISKTKFPWEKQSKGPEPLGRDQVDAVLSIISKPARKN